MGGAPGRGVPLPQPPHHCRTCPRVSGSLRARELPRASAAEANRMGTALVMPTKDVKMLMPSTAASLHSAFRNPNAVVLGRMGRAGVGGGTPGGRGGCPASGSTCRGQVAPRNRHLGA